MNEERAPALDLARRRAASADFLGLLSPDELPTYRTQLDHLLPEAWRVDVVKQLPHAELGGERTVFAPGAPALALLRVLVNALSNHPHPLFTDAPELRAWVNSLGSDSPGLRVRGQFGSQPTPRQMLNGLRNQASLQARLGGPCLPAAIATWARIADEVTEEARELNESPVDRTIIRQGLRDVDRLFVKIREADRTVASWGARVAGHATSIGELNARMRSVLESDETPLPARLLALLHAIELLRLLRTSQHPRTHIEFFDVLVETARLSWLVRARQASQRDAATASAASPKHKQTTSRSR